MSGTERKVDSTGKPGVVPPWEALAMVQADSGLQPVVTRSKLRVEKSEQLLVWEEGTMAGSLYIGLKPQWMEAAKVKFPLILLGVAVTQGSKWKARRAAEWEELAEWKPLTTNHSLLVEQLQERFGGMEIRGVALVKSLNLGALLGTGQA